ncbi:hypothetical protein BpHYR1_045608 [Brachionus plicatilis]|uniref:Uncharacterized protein n=1 Tax=Brachionus plicatilis TaxID=10195 RepID=A0A3M7S612_BRAPC|nr:hypothetical protein BpHYR1_045608 [Brachionus plicatilis]
MAKKDCIKKKDLNSLFRFRARLNMIARYTLNSRLQAKLNIHNLLRNSRYSHKMINLKKDSQVRAFTVLMAKKLSFKFYHLNQDWIVLKLFVLSLLIHDLLNFFISKPILGVCSSEEASLCLKIMASKYTAQKLPAEKNENELDE